MPIDITAINTALSDMATPAVPAPAASTAPTVPALDAFVSNLPDVPSAGTIAVPYVGAVPSMTLVAPVVSLPATPTVTGITGVAPPGTAPALEATLPSALSVTLPDAPTFTPITIPSTPTYTATTFDDAIPTFSATLPTAYSYVEDAYTSALLEVIQTALTTELAGVDYALDPTDEAVLWLREREKALREVVEASRTLSAKSASRGFMLPPGQLFGQLEATRRDALDKAKQANVAAMQSRSEQLVKLGQSTVSRATQLESGQRGAFNARMARTLKSAQTSYENALAIFDLGSKQLTAKVEAYRAEASLFEARVHDALLAVDTYKARVEAAQLDARQQRVHAEVYKAQFAGATAYIDVYKAQVEGRVREIENERLKLDRFKVTVDAYGAQLRAKNTEVQIYNATLNGELAKADVYRAELSAYNSKLGAIRSKVEAGAVAASAQLAIDKFNVDAYTTSLHGKEVELKAAEAKIEAALTLYGADVTRYKAQTDANVGLANAATTINKYQADVILSNTSMGIAYEVGVKHLAMAVKHLSSAEAIATWQMTSASLMNAAHISSSAFIAAERNKSAGAITQVKLDSDVAISTRRDEIDTLITNVKNADSVDIANRQGASQTFISGWSNSFNNAVGLMARDVAYAENESAEALQQVNVSLIQAAL